MLDHMLFNRLKWWNISGNDEQVSANGKNFLAIPSRLVVGSNSMVMFVNNLNSADTRFPEINQDITVNCVGVTKDAYLFDGEISWSDEYGHTYSYTLKYDPINLGNTFGVVLKNKVKSVIWGGKTSPSHFWQWIRSLLCSRKVVAVC